MVIYTRVKQAVKKFVKVLRYGKDDVQTADYALPFGIDSKPVKDILAVHAETGSSEGGVVLGYIQQFAVTKEGENRIYATDANGNEVFSVFFKRDGTCEFGGTTDFAVRFNKLETGFNQLKADHNALITAFNTHLHATAATGPPSTPTPGAGIPATTSIASIADAKIDEIKVSG